MIWSEAETEYAKLEWGDTRSKEWERLFMADWCTHVVVTGRSFSKRHLMSCTLSLSHDGDCIARDQVHHDCKKNGCNDPVLMDRYDPMERYLNDEDH